MLHHGDLRETYWLTIVVYRPKDSNLLHAPQDLLAQQPVGSSVNSHTAKLSAYVAEFLRPLTRKLPSHIWHTTVFIKRLRRLGKVPESCILFTLGNSFI